LASAWLIYRAQSAILGLSDSDAWENRDRCYTKVCLQETSSFIPLFEAVFHVLFVSLTRSRTGRFRRKIKAGTAKVAPNRRKLHTKRMRSGRPIY
jgi:hypothetical protein